jgi:hypothetical protein
MIQITEEASEFADVILKHYDKDHKHKHTHNNKSDGQINKEKPKVEPKDPLDKYNLDYSKWKNLEEEEKPKEVDEQTKQLQSQMGCFHDRRKVFLSRVKG